MSIKTITTCVIDCEDCDKRFGDLVEQNEQVVVAIAKQHLWEVSEGGGVHRCPECAKARRVYVTCPECKGKTNWCHLCFGHGQVYSRNS